jgi:ferredoxin
MPQASLRKEHFGKFVAAVSKGRKFFGPLECSDGVQLAELSPQDVPAFEYGNFTLPPKRFFLPRSEVIAVHGPGGMAATPPSQERVVLFGVRPCDAMSLTYMDKVFIDETYVDPYYRSRRENTLIITLACRQPAVTCFCASVKGCPAGTAGADIAASDLGDALLLESITDAGHAFLAEHAGLMGKPSTAQLKARDSQHADAGKKMSPVDVEKLPARLQAAFESKTWDDISQRCLGCGVCTFLCPTCHCFGLHDEQVGPVQRRVRAQDACAFPTFTLEASGHNPRTRQGARMRQRVMHKFCYAAENFGELFCVGCGRCIRSCPANLDIRQTLAEVPE